MGHCRLMVQQPKKFEQRSKLLSSEAKQQLKELLALYKEPKIGEVFVDPQDAEDCGGTVRQVRTVDTDDLDFSWPNISGGSPPKKSASGHWKKHWACVFVAWPLLVMCVGFHL